MRMQLSDALLNAIDFRLVDIHTAIPGIVQSYDPATQQAEVQVAIKKTYGIAGEDVVLDAPVITSVPVVFPSTKNSFLIFPVEQGDSVLLVFSERSLERWLSAGGVVEGGINRKFDLTDAIAIVGLHAFNEPITADSASLTLQHKSAAIKLTDDSKVSIGNDQLELLDWLDRLVTEIKAITVDGNPIENIAAFATLQTELGNLKT